MYELKGVCVNYVCDDVWVRRPSHTKQVQEQGLYQLWTTHPRPPDPCQARLSKDGLFARGYSSWTHAIRPYTQIFKPAHCTEKQITTTARLASHSNTVIRNAISNLTVPNIFWFPFSVGKHFYQYFLKYTRVWLGMIVTIIKGIKTLVSFFFFLRRK